MSDSSRTFERLGEGLLNIGTLGLFDQVVTKPRAEQKQAKQIAADAKANQDAALKQQEERTAVEAKNAQDDKVRAEALKRQSRAARGFGSGTGRRSTFLTDALGLSGGANSNANGGTSNLLGL